jgi:protein-S-isoprenylcysteine O-methyltransferase Ste14
MAANVKNKPGQATSHTGPKIQPFLLALIHIAAAFVIRWLVPIPVSAPGPVQATGFLLVILGFLLGLGASLAFRRARARSNAHAAKLQLIQGGIYRFTRNPIYLGFLLMLIGMPLNVGSYWGIVLVPVMVILFNRLVIEPEEEALLQKFGNEYTSYAGRVRRWI